MDLADVLNYFYTPYGIKVTLDTRRRQVGHQSKSILILLTILLAFDLILRLLIFYVHNYPLEETDNSQFYQSLVGLIESIEHIYPTGDRLDMTLAVEFFIRLQALCLTVVYLSDNHEWLGKVNERFRLISSIGFTQRLHRYRRFFHQLLGLTVVFSLLVGIISSVHLVSHIEDMWTLLVTITMLVYRCVIIGLCYTFSLIFLSRFFMLVQMCRLFAGQLNDRLVEAKVLNIDRTGVMLVACGQMFDQYANYLLFLHLCNNFLVKHYSVLTGGILLLTIPCYRDLLFTQVDIVTATLVLAFLFGSYGILLLFSKSIGDIETETKRNVTSVYHKLVIQHLGLISVQTESFKNDVSRGGVGGVKVEILKINNFPQMINFFSAIDIVHVGYPNTPINLQTIISIFTVFFSATALLVG